VLATSTHVNSLAPTPAAWQVFLASQVAHSAHGASTGLAVASHRMKLPVSMRFYVFDQQERFALLPASSRKPLLSPRRLRQYIPEMQINPSHFEENY
jgi:hypothetical protein